MVSPRTYAAQRADRDDPPSVTRSHQSRRFLTTEERPLQIDGMNEVPLLFGYFKRIDLGEAGGIVHKSVEPSHGAGDLREHGPDLCDVLEVRPKDRGASGFGRDAIRVFLGRAVVNQNARSLPCEL